MIHACPYCFEEFEANIFFEHVKSTHKKTKKNDFECCHCKKKYWSFPSYGKHLRMKHDDTVVEESESDDMLSEIIDNDDDSTEIEVRVPLKTINPSSFDSFASNVFTSIDDFAAKLYAMGNLPRCQANEILNNVASLNNSIFTQISHQLSESDESRINLETNAQIVRNIFSQFRTEYRTTKVFKKVNKLIPSETKTVTYTMDVKRKNKRRKLTDKKIKIEIIPMKEVLKTFLELSNVFSSIIEYIEKCRISNVVDSVIQTPVWKRVEEKYKDKLVLPLYLYEDETEINNPLGSRKGIHQLGAVYFTISCIPPKHGSLQENIFVAQLHNSKDAKKVGNKLIYSNVIDQLDDLAKNGVEITVDGGTRIVYFVLLALIGDNLTQNNLLGFSSSFNVDYICRMCTVDKGTLKTQVRENTKLLRTERNYSKNVVARSKGLVSICEFNRLSNFHSITNVCFDIDHDFKEGIHRYVMGKILHKLIMKHKFFSLETLNWRLKFFKFSPGSNIPPPILESDLKKKCIVISASEMATLVYNFALLVGDLVPKSTKEWHLYILLRKITILVSSPVYDPCKRVLGEELMSQHHSLYMELFNVSLTPKFHFALHYWSAMALMGPMSHYKTNRFERKHQEIKKIAKSTSSRVNPAHTIALGHQLTQSYRFLNNSGFTSRLSWGPAIANKISEIPGLASIATITNFDITDECLITSWAEIYGTRYETMQCISIHKLDDLDRTFGMIKYILLTKEENPRIFLFYTKLSISEFDEHLQSFHVVETSEWGFLLQKSLSDYEPLDTHALNGKCYIPLMN